METKKMSRKTVDMMMEHKSGDMNEPPDGSGPAPAGSFFLPRDLQKTPPAKQTNYEGLAYFGEYPLAWAACLGNESAYNLLVDRGADPNSQDTLGNMVLHMVVVTDRLVSHLLVLCLFFTIQLIPKSRTKVTPPPSSFIHQFSTRL